MKVLLIHGTSETKMLILRTNLLDLFPHRRTSEFILKFQIRLRKWIEGRSDIPLLFIRILIR